jgi:DASH complex subunit SPC19
MSRHLRPARESIFTSGPDHYRGESQVLCPPNLRECVLAMEDCCQEAHAAQELLHDATKDLPRIKKVLESQRVSVSCLIQFSIRSDA